VEPEPQVKGWLVAAIAAASAYAIAHALEQGREDARVSEQRRVLKAAFRPNRR
jgi:hypothetical protein